MTYTCLLTDRWPSFSETPEDAVFVRVAGPLPLNRAAVFFRFILAFPIAMLAGLLMAGLAVAGFFAWLVVVIVGRVPQPLFDATASVVRLHTRYYAYLGLLTARYPHGLFGEPQEQQEPPSAEPESPPVPPAINRPARRLLVTIVVLGSAVFVAYMVVGAIVGVDAARRQQAADDLAGAYAAVHITQTSDCVGNGDPLGCLKQVEQQNASTMRTFEESVSTIDFPGDTVSDVAALRQATDVYIADLDALGQATTLQEFGTIAAQRDADQAARAVDDAVRQLERKLDRTSNS